MTKGDSPAMPLCQIALTTTNIVRTHRWYRETFGFLAAGAKRHLRKSPNPSDVWCLVDQRHWFQLELFEFRHVVRKPRDWKASDLGYSMIGLHVESFEDVIERIHRGGSRLLSEPIGEPGRRRASLLDPEGILLEVMEDLPVSHGAVPLRAGVPTRACSITVSVPDLERASRFWIEILGLKEVKGGTLHTREHEALWGLEGATSESLLLSSGDFLVDLKQYTSPKGRSLPHPRLLWRQGILNVAFGSHDKEDFDALYKKLCDAGFSSDFPPWTLADIATVVYLRDHDDISVELLHVAPQGMTYMGFVPNDDQSE